MAAVPCFPHRAQSGLDAVVPGGKGAAVWYPSHGGYLRNQSCGKHIHPIHLGQAHSGYPGGNEGMRGYAGHEGTYYRGRLHLHDGKGREDFVQQGLHAVGICGEGIPSASERGGG